MEKPPRRQLEIISKGTFVDKPELIMSLSGWKSLRGFAAFCGVCPRSEHRDRGCWLSCNPWCGVFHPSASLHPAVRVSLKPSVGQTSPGSARLLSGYMKSPWGDWGCVGLCHPSRDHCNPFDRGFAFMGAVGMGWVQGLRGERWLLHAASQCCGRALLTALSPPWMLLPRPPACSTQSSTLFPYISQGRNSFHIFHGT